MLRLLSKLLKAARMRGYLWHERKTQQLDSGYRTSPLVQDA